MYSVFSLPLLMFSEMLYLTSCTWTFQLPFMFSSKEACLFMCVCLSFSLRGYTHIPCIFVSCFLSFNFSRLLAHLLFNSSLHDFWTDKKTFHIKPPTWHLKLGHFASFFNIVTSKRKESTDCERSGTTCLIYVLWQCCKPVCAV